MRKERGREKDKTEVCMFLFRIQKKNKKKTDVKFF